MFNNIFTYETIDILDDVNIQYNYVTFLVDFGRIKAGDKFAWVYVESESNFLRVGPNQDLTDAFDIPFKVIAV